jgi:hypothetical protein
MSRDLIPTAEIKDLLRDAYHHVSLTTAPVAHNLYSYEGLALVPQSAIDRALGVAKPPVSRHYSVRQHCARPRVRTRHRHHLAGAPHRPHAIALGFLPEMVTRTADACAESVCPTWSRWRVSWRPFRCRTTVT